MQAKIEPGNLNVVQLSPTLQATRSNYTRVHGGKSPTYLEYFNGEKNVIVLVDQLQSEQGARFLHKRNRNIIVEVDENEEIEVKSNFIWVSLGQIKELLRYPNVVNMDSRTVISCIKFGSYSERSLKLLDRVKLMGGIRSNKPDSFLYSVLSAETHRTLLRRLAAHMDMTAVKTYPTLLGIVAAEEPALTVEPCIVSKPSTMLLFYLGYGAELPSCLGEALVIGDTSKVGIYNYVLLFLFLLRSVKKLPDVLEHIGRIACSNVNGLSGGVLHKLPEHHCMAFLLLGCEPEHTLKSDEFLLLSYKRRLIISLA